MAPQLAAPQPYPTVPYPTALLCDDSHSDISSPRQLLDEWARAEPHRATSAQLARLAGPLACMGWPNPTPNPQHRLHIHGTPQILIVNCTTRPRDIRGRSTSLVIHEGAGPVKGLLLLFFLGFPACFGQARVRCRGSRLAGGHPPAGGLGLDADAVRGRFMLPWWPHPAPRSPPRPRVDGQRPAPRTRTERF